jgi:hypothetical protein
MLQIYFGLMSYILYNSNIRGKKNYVSIIYINVIQFNKQKKKNPKGALIKYYI